MRCNCQKVRVDFNLCLDFSKTVLLLHMGVYEQVEDIKGLKLLSPFTSSLVFCYINPVIEILLRQDDVVASSSAEFCHGR